MMKRKTIAFLIGLVLCAGCAVGVTQDAGNEELSPDQSSLYSATDTAAFDAGQFAFTYEGVGGHVLWKDAPLDDQIAIPKDLSERAGLSEQNLYYDHLMFLDHGRFVAFEGWDRDDYTLFGRYLFDIELNDFVQFPAQMEIIGWNEVSGRLILGDRQEECSLEDILSMDPVARPPSDYILYEYDLETERLTETDRLFIDDYEFNFSLQTGDHLSLQFQKCPACNFECVQNKKIYLYGSGQSYDYPAYFPQDSTRSLVKIVISPQAEHAIFISYNIYDPVTSGLMVGDINGSSFTEIYREEGWEVRDAKWSGDGRSIAFLLQTTDLENRIKKVMVISTDGTDAMLLSERDPVLLGWNGDEYVVFQEENRDISMINVFSTDGSYMDFLEIQSDQVVWSEKP